MADEAIRVTREGRVGIIAFGRPEVLNAFNTKLKDETCAAMADLSADPAILAIIIHGQGRAFSAGFDMKESASRSTEGVAAWREVLVREFDFIMQFWNCPKPTIAAVHGFCLAGAFELALACDLTVAAEGTRFGEPEVRFGSGLIALLLPWMTTPKFAKELLLTGIDTVDARRALDMGIVNRVVAAGSELDVARKLAADLCATAPIALQATKCAINRTFDIMGMREALLAGLDADIMIEATSGPEKQEFNRRRKEEGLKAALAWRDAKFS